MIQSATGHPSLSWRQWFVHKLTEGRCNPSDASIFVDKCIHICLVDSKQTVSLVSFVSALDLAASKFILVSEFPFLVTVLLRSSESWQVLGFARRGYIVQDTRVEEPLLRGDIHIKTQKYRRGRWIYNSLGHVMVAYRLWCYAGTESWVSRIHHLNEGPLVFRRLLRGLCKS